ncbi:hypothetical protein NP493_6313g00000 [Ridgeia piscesae]|nr:hypothetical protein NP493_6313g00000 [Ridgeia piscesae]
MGITLCGVRHIPEGIFLKAAEVLASLVTKADLDEGRVYPSLGKIFQVSVLIAIKVATYVYEQKLASHYPEPVDKELFVRSHLYETEYESFIPDTYDWPESSL